MKRSCQRISLAGLVDEILLLRSHARGSVTVLISIGMAVPSNGTVRCAMIAILCMLQGLSCSFAVPTPLSVKLDVGVSLDIEGEGDENVAHDGGDYANER